MPYQTILDLLQYFVVEFLSRKLLDRIGFVCQAAMLSRPRTLVFRS